MLRHYSTTGRGPIIGLRLHGHDPIFTCGLRIWQWFFYGLRLQHKMRLASLAVNSQRFTALGMRMRLLVEVTACGAVRLLTSSEMGFKRPLGCAEI